MVKVVLVNKLGQLKESGLKSANREELYRKAGFKKADGFSLRTTWALSLGDGKIEVELWARDDGKAGTENKYDFPPPVDTSLYFGTCVLLRRSCDDQSLRDLTIDTWSKAYEKLFGGFEDLDEPEASSEDELSGVPEALKTHHGYLKDGFVCDDGAGSASEDDDDLEDDLSEDGDDNIIIVDSNSRQRTRHAAAPSDTEGSEGSDFDAYDDSELVPERYVYSDDE